GIFTMSLLNLFHYGETGMLTYRGEKNYQRLEASCGVPYLFGVALFADAGFGLEIQQNDYGYLHGELQLTTDMLPNWQWGLALTAHETTHYVDSSAVGSKFEGLDFVMSRRSRPYRAGETSTEAQFKLGSGLTQASAVQLTRWHIDLGAGKHVPFLARHAVVGRMFLGVLLTDARDTLQNVELYRTGGYKSVRGYLDNQFALTSVLYGQAEYHYYFNYSGSIYFFSDFGACRLNKSSDPQTSSALQKMIGYGLGIQIPVKIGDAAIEWARNYRDTHNWGRIHISIRNAVAAGLPR
ncbi:MAG TPA: BamA/TamA family outer membrane protein, partial [Chitinivibrionales bacterium]